MASTTGYADMSITPGPCAGHDLAVQPVDAKQIIPFDGPVFEVETLSHGIATSTSEDDTSTEVETGALQSPFQSPSSFASGVLSDTSLEDGEIQESVVKDSSAMGNAVLNGQKDLANVAEEEPKDTGISDKHKDATIEALSSIDKTVTNAQETDNAATTSSAPSGTNDATDPEDDLDVNSATIPDVPAKEALELPAVDYVAGAMQNNAVITDGEQTIKNVEQSKPTSSVPPHLRPDLQSSMTPHCSLGESSYSNAAPGFPGHAEIPRAPRKQYAHGTYRNHDGREEVARLTAQLMKVHNDLDVERKTSATMRKSVEEEIQKNMDAALASMTTDLLNKQFKTLTHQGKVEAMERDLLFRHARIEQLEVFLSEGQKQVYRQSDPEDGEDKVRLTMAEVNREHDRLQAELKAQKDMADREGKLALRYEGLKILEEAQEKRERHYKTLFRKSIEAEIRENNIPNIDAKLNEVADVEYNRGFGVGKAAGRVEAEKEAREKGFLEGYGTCRRAEIALSKMRKGLIARDSPELDFVFDSTHPHHLFTMGAQIGGMSSSQNKKPMASSVAPRQVQIERQPIPEQRRVEEPVRRKVNIHFLSIQHTNNHHRLPPPRPTFAAELRGAVHMHNGQHVLANGSAPATPAPPAPVNGIDGAKGGRPIIDYGKVETDNLIDFY